MNIPYDLRIKQKETEKEIEKTLYEPDFLDKYTRKTLRQVMVDLFPYEVIVNQYDDAFSSMTKKRMYKHLIGYGILKGWNKD